MARVAVTAAAAASSVLLRTLKVTRVEQRTRLWKCLLCYTSSSSFSSAGLVVAGAAAAGDVTVTVNTAAQLSAAVSFSHPPRRDDVYSAAGYYYNNCHYYNCYCYYHTFCSEMAKYQIVMVRHGESEWNKLNKFCGWHDAQLSEQGVKEAHAAGKALKDAKFKFDLAHTSVLTRANKTLDAILEEIGQTDIPIQKTWRLNERHYGGLTGLNKAETALKHGEEQVKIWRRSFDIPPPPMDESNPHYKEILEDPRYADGPSKDEFPMFESLKLTIQRTLPYWNDVIVPQMKAGKKILIAAHGNSLRGIVKHLDSMSDEAIMGLNLPTGIPFVYELDENLKPVVSMKFLGDEETVRKAMEAVAAQGKAK